MNLNLSNAQLKRPHLVIVRAGHASLHNEWLSNGENRTWDLVVSSYSEQNCLGSCDQYVYIKGGKWSGIYNTLKLLKRPLEDYRYVWLPDDDIAANCEKIELLFSAMSAFDLNLGQPSLSWDSYVTYPHTLNCLFTSLRYTDLVELMMPCFRTSYLRQIQPYFAATQTGWGFDWIWSRLEKDNVQKCAILDLVTMRHTRPLGGNLYQYAASVGEDASQHMENFMEKFPEVGLDFSPSCYSSILRRGSKALGPKATGALQMISHRIYLSKSPENKPIADNRLPLSTLFRARPPDLTRLPLGRLSEYLRK